MADQATQSTLDAVERFNAAFNAHDVDATMACMTEDCIFENTAPPAGERHVGATAVRAAWEDLFTVSPSAHFDAEEIIAVGDRCIVRWRYTWTEGEGGFIRGVDVMRVRDGKVAEKLAYVKG